MKIRSITNEKEMKEFLDLVRSGEEHLSARQACKLKCYDCCLYDLAEARKCPAGCEINVFQHPESRTLKPVILNYCRNCNPDVKNGNPLDCDSLNCPLHAYLHRKS